jgi:hypothetical protein
MFELKIMIAIIAVLIVIATIIISIRLQELIDVMKRLHMDISVIRLDNMRTMADIRRRNR